MIVWVMPFFVFLAVVSDILVHAYARFVSDRKKKPVLTGRSLNLGCGGTAGAGVAGFPGWPGESLRKYWLGALYCA